MSYSAKFSSAYYGPFRDICKSAPSARGLLKDRRSYQISMLNAADAVASAHRDIREGADIIMVKPGILYLDILQSMREEIQSPPVSLSSKRLISKHRAPGLKRVFVQGRRSFGSLDGHGTRWC